ncbi:hypothetical protein IFR05_017409 [Cadophora sp. M221]|nr:hypothetical protein IFR05_017409 [Cadophora sp. M221]
MSDEASPAAAVVSTPAEVEPARPEVATAPEAKEDVVVKEANGDAEISGSKEVATEDAPADIGHIFTMSRSTSTPISSLLCSFYWESGISSNALSVDIL